MSTNRIFVIGASAGGVETLKQLVSLLPSSFPAPILIVLHVSPYGGSVLPRILTRAGGVPAVHPEDGQPLKPGTIYVAPPDWHLLVRKDRVSLSRGPRENNHRPSVDTLFRSAARTFGPRVVGIVLSGVLDDGTAGLATIVELGGVGVAQDPSDALYPGMPESAVEHVNVHHILPVSEIAPLMVRLAGEIVAVTQPAVPDDVEYETDIVELDMDAIEDKDRIPGELSSYVCPECGGALWEINEGEVLRFRCHVGHAYSAETFLAEQREGVEAALWAALRIIEDNISLTRQMAERAVTFNRPRAAARYARQIASAQSQAALLHDVLKVRASTISNRGSEESGATTASRADQDVPDES